MVALLIRVAVFVVPIAAAIGTASVAAALLPRPRDLSPLVAWWIVMLVAPFLVMKAVEHVARRALPLASLLKMNLIFPEQAPARLAVARKAGSIRRLQAELDYACQHGIEDDATVAAGRVLALVGALSTHDRLTRGHSERVRAYTDMVAEEMRLPEQDRNRLRWAAMLHDIGKLSVPASVLNKPGRPDNYEWEILRAHPEEGARMISPLAEWLGPWSAAVAEHHERYDGTGYPWGLAGEQISLGGRIVAVADSYEAITAARSYKKSVSHEAACRELAACAGTHFDPQVVRAFLAVSVGKLRFVAGPLALLGELPILEHAPRLIDLAGTAARTLATVSAASGVGTVVAHHVPPSNPAPSVVAVETGRVVPVTAAPPPAPVAIPVPSTRVVAPTSTTSTTVPAPTITSTTAPPATTTTTTTLAPPSTTTTTVPVPIPATTTTTVAAATVPGSPTGLYLSPADGTMTATWSAPANDGGQPIEMYRVQVSGSDGSVIEQVSNRTQSVIAGLTDGVRYTVTVTAVNPPSPPTAVAGPETATVSWTAPSATGGSPVTAYLVTPYLASNGTALAPVSVSGTATDTTVSGLTDGTGYTFTVSAENAQGIGTASPPSGAVTPATLPTAPMNVTAAAGDTEAVVSWSPPASDGGSPVTSYLVTTYPVGGGVAAPPVTVAAGTDSVMIPGLTDGVPYQFTVTAANAVGTGPESAGSAEVVPAPPAVPVPPQVQPAPIASAGAGAITVSWSSSAPSVTDVVITPYENGVAQQPQTFSALPSTTSETLHGLTDGASYTFTVTLVDASGAGPESARSNPVTFVEVPGAPTSLASSANGGVLTLSWRAPLSNGGSPIRDYVVSVVNASNPNDVTTGSVQGTGATVTGLTPGVVYDAYVYAENAVGSGPSVEIGPLMVVGPPAAPSAVSAVPTYQAATVTWTAPTSNGGSPLTGYTVTPLYNGLALSFLSVQVPAGQTTAVVTGLVDGASYRFQVTATNGSGTGPGSGLSPSVTPARSSGPTPPAPNKQAATAGNSSATVTWAEPNLPANASAVSYWIVTAYPAGGWLLPVVSQAVPASMTSAQVTGLNNGTAYSFTVTAVNGAGASSPSGSTPPVTPGVAPSPPGHVSATLANGSSVGVTWTAPSSPTSPVTGYIIETYQNGALLKSQNAGANATSATVGVPRGASYVFDVIAVNATADSTPGISNTVTVP